MWREKRAPKRGVVDARTNGLRECGNVGIRERRRGGEEETGGESIRIGRSGESSERRESESKAGEREKGERERRGQGTHEGKRMSSWPPRPLGAGGGGQAACPSHRRRAHGEEGGESEADGAK